MAGIGDILGALGKGIATAAPYAIPQYRKAKIQQWAQASQEQAEQKKAQKAAAFEIIKSEAEAGNTKMVEAFGDKFGGETKELLSSVAERKQGENIAAFLQMVQGRLTAGGGATGRFSHPQVDPVTGETVGLITPSGGSLVRGQPGVMPMVAPEPGGEGGRERVRNISKTGEVSFQDKPKPSAKLDREERIRWDKNIASLQRTRGLTRSDAIAETSRTPGFETVPERYLGEVPAVGMRTQPSPGQAPQAAPLLPTGEPTPTPSISLSQPADESSQLVEQPEVGTTTATPKGQVTTAFTDLENMQPRKNETMQQFKQRKKLQTDALAEADIPITDPKILAQYIDSEGQPAPLGITQRELIDSGEYKAATGKALKLKGGSLAVLSKMAFVWEKEYKGNGRWHAIGRYWRQIKGDKTIQDVNNFEATLGNLIQDIADEGRRVSDADAKRFKNLILSLWDTDETSFSKMVYVTQMLERSYIGSGKPVPKELMNVKKRFNIPTIEVAPDPNIPLTDAIMPGRAIPAPGPVQLEAFPGFSLGPRQE